MSFLRVSVLVGLLALPAQAQDVPSSPRLVAVTAMPAPPAVGEAGLALVEPQLRVRGSGDQKHPRVALTFDACMGAADQRILSVLVAERIPATIFVTARWLRRNPQTLAELAAHPDLFELENHGENHVPAVDQPVLVYGIAAAGSAQAVNQEVEGGARAMQMAGLQPPRWFRGSTAKYDLSAIRQIRAMGYRVAGYSLNGDGGSLLGAAVAERRIAAAKDGDVVLAHINQPTHAAGEGVARALLALKQRGVDFVRLSDVEDIGDHETTR
jgi:peptidoglycan/xylan/chitin deacetylase (PgdA/CDA1 family)